MISNEKIVHSVMEVIDELNRQLPKDKKLKKSIDTALFGTDGNLDSLGFISLVTIVEKKIDENFGISITIIDELATLEDENPFKTVKSLIEYIGSLLEKISHE